MPRRWLIDAERGIALAQPAGVMGIINLTPDSFSDGGLHATPVMAAQAAVAMLASGADWLDLGGESTRPGAPPVDAATELSRVLPALAAIRSAGVRLPLSIDTCKGVVAAEALRCGADAINDVSGGRDPALLEVAASARCALVLMHMQGDPATMQVAPRYADVVAEVESSLAASLARAVGRGVRESAIVLDPGIGFGKTAAHNLALLGALPRFVRNLGRPLLVGISRKSMLRAVTGVDHAPPDRDAVGHVGHALLAPQCALLRVHDVGGARSALRLASCLAEAA
jgi:dihydropteroate synthase